MRPACRRGTCKLATGRVRVAAATGPGGSRYAKTAASDHRTRCGRARENRKLPSTVRSLNCRFGRRPTGAGLLRIRLQCLRTSNLRYQNLVRRNSILRARLRTLLQLLCAAFSTKDRKLKHRSHSVACEGGARLAIAKYPSRRSFPHPNTYSLL